MSRGMGIFTERSDVSAAKNDVVFHYWRITCLLVKLCKHYSWNTISSTSCGRFTMKSSSRYRGSSKIGWRVICAGRSARRDCPFILYSRKAVDTLKSWSLSLYQPTLFEVFRSQWIYSTSLIADKSFRGIRSCASQIWLEKMRKCSRNFICNPLYNRNLRVDWSNV
jgi:hypothetical protein